MVYYIAYDPTQPVGSRLPPEVVAEIAAVAPSTVTNGSIQTQHLADDAVTNAKIAAGAVGTTEIAQNGVREINIQGGAVTNTKLGDGSVTAAKTAAGVVDVTDSTGAPIQLTVVELTAAQYAQITTPDPNIEYHISG